MLLRQSEVKNIYSISKTTLHRWIREGILTNYRTVGGHRRYDSKEIEAILSVSGDKYKRKEGNDAGS